MKKNEIEFEVHEEVGVPRRNEIVQCGLPVPATPVWRETTGCEVVTEIGEVIPTQVLWEQRDPDDTLRWIGVAFPLTIDPLDRRKLTLRCAGGPRSAPAHPAGIAADGSALLITTGLSTWRVELEPVSLMHDQAALQASRFALTAADGLPAFAHARKVSITQDGPLVAEAILSGRYESATGSVAAFQARIVALAGSDSIEVDVRLINDQSESQAEFRQWSIGLTTPPVVTGTCGVFERTHRSQTPFTLSHRGEGHARGIFATSRVHGGSAWAETNPEGYESRWEWAELQDLQATNWVAVETESPARSLTVAVHRFGENYPADLSTLESGVSLGLWPDGGPPLVLAQGMAKTRRFRITSGEDPTSGLRLDSRLIPHVLAAIEAPPAKNILPYVPDHYPNLESHIRSELFAWYQSSQSLGFVDFGDGMQGISKGPRTGYSANNEHDALFALCLHYIRSGERAYYDSAEAYADHLVDIDLIHHSTAFPDEVGGLRAHGRGHLHPVTARTPTGLVTTSLDTGHLWVEGLVLFGQLSGDQRYLEAAKQVGDCIVRLTELGWTRPEPGPRNSGWPLIALACLFRATGDGRYLDAARRTAKAALSVQRDDGRWLMRLGMVDDYCAWQNSVLLTGLKRQMEIDPDPDLRRAFLAGAYALIDKGRNPDGTFVYLHRFDYRWAYRSGKIREALALAFDETEDERFLQAGLAGGFRWYRPHAAVPPTSNDIAEWRGHLPFLGRAHEHGLLQDLADY